jgi:hypothetical protein
VYKYKVKHHQIDNLTGGNNTIGVRNKFTFLVHKEFFMHNFANKLLFSFTLCSGLVFIVSRNVCGMSADQSTRIAEEAYASRQPTIQQCLDGLELINAIKEFEKPHNKLDDTTSNQQAECLHLRLAIGAAYSEIISRINNGIYLDMQDDEGRTPLMLATEMGLSGLVQYLVEANASLAIVNRKNQTARELAVLICKNNHVDYANLLIADYLEAAELGISYEQLLEKRQLATVYGKVLGLGPSDE